MLQVLSIMSKFIFAPVWLLWKGYGLLWWAFEGTGRLAEKDAAREPDRGNSFDISDSRPCVAALAAPTGLLRGGFIGTLMASGVFAGFASLLAEGHAVSSDRAWALWACGTGFAAVGSIFAVRRVAMARARRKTLAGRVKERAVGGARRAVAAGAAAGVAVSAAVQEVGRAAGRTVDAVVERVRGGTADRPDPSASGKGAGNAEPCRGEVPLNIPHATPIGGPAGYTRGCRLWPFSVAGGAAKRCMGAGVACGRVAGRAARAAAAGARHAAASYRENPSHTRST